MGLPDAVTYGASRSPVPAAEERGFPARLELLCTCTATACHHCQRHFSHSPHHRSIAGLQELQLSDLFGALRVRFNVDNLGAPRTRNKLLSVSGAGVVAQ